MQSTLKILKIPYEHICMHALHTAYRTAATTTPWNVIVILQQRTFLKVLISVHAHDINSTMDFVFKNKNLSAH